MKFRKRPVEVEAVQITHDWFTGPHPNPLHPVGLRMNPLTRTVEIELHDRITMAQVGDWIVTEADGSRFSCKPEVFEKAYEPKNIKEAT